MNVSTTEKQSSSCQQSYSLTTRQELLCRRMLSFLYETKPVGHISYSFSPNSHPRFSHFTVRKHDTAGIEFDDVAFSRGQAQRFFVPAEYFENPEAWERGIISAMAQDRELARKEIEKRLGAVSPDEFTLDVIRISRNEAGKVRLKVRLHPGMRTACNEQLVALFGGKGILAVPVFNIEVS